MFGLRRPAFAFWLLVVCGGVMVVAWSVAVAATDLRWLGSAFFWFVAGTAADTFPVRVPSARRQNTIMVSAASAVYLAVAFLFPVPWAVLVTVAAAGLGTLLRSSRAHPHKVFFNVGQYALAVAAAGGIWHLGGGQRPLGEWQSAPWLVLSLAAYYVVNSVIVNTMVALADHRVSLARLFTAPRTILPVWGGMLALAPLFAHLYLTGPWLTALAVIAIVVLYLTFARAAENERLARATLFELADIIDARDGYTGGHSKRVGECAERVALALGLSEEDAYLVFLAGRLHDLGKCAIDNEVLRKPGPLDDAEREHMCVHPEVGAQMLEKLTLFREVAAFVRAHHERWDGAGYPDGLQGEGIPLAARIIAVTDSFDAMVTDRPYRRGMSAARARELLRAGAGSQWDPRLVASFLGLLDRGAVTVPQPAQRPLSAPSSVRVATPA